MVRAGQVDCAVTGGAEACITFGTVRGWEAMRVMSPDVCRPFSKDRMGLILGEGAAMMVLEPLERAQARGANTSARSVGFGMSADAADLTAPDQGGMVRAMQSALADARMVPADIQYINAHGTGTAANDETETKALHEAFGPHAEKLAVSSTKSMVGHALGAAGALELVATILAVREALCRRLSGIWRRIRPAISIMCRTPRARSRSRPRCQIRSHSAGSTPCWR